jgi:cobalamin biosynthesis protein CobD/CbiB
MIIMQSTTWFTSSFTNRVSSAVELLGIVLWLLFFLFPTSCHWSLLNRIYSEVHWFTAWTIIIQSTTWFTSSFTNRVSSAVLELLGIVLWLLFFLFPTSCHWSLLSRIYYELVLSTNYFSLASSITGALSFWLARHVAKLCPKILQELHLEACWCEPRDHVVTQPIIKIEI